jgi:uncharacterized RDD family membrane protein YckC
MTDQDDRSGPPDQPPPSPYGQSQSGQPPPSPYGQSQYGQPPPSPYGQSQYGQPPYGSSGTPMKYPGSGSPAIAYTVWHRRAAGYLVDYLPVYIIVLIGVSIHIALLAVLFVLVALAYTVYNRWILGGHGQSLGKRAMGIKLIGEQTGQPIGTLMAFVRDICHILDSLVFYIGWLFPLWDAKRQTFADKIMRTVVVPA